MANKTLHCYELIIRSQGRDMLVLRTCDIAKIKREYNGHRARQVYSRIRVDGQELAIIMADKLCQKASKNKDVFTAAAKLQEG